MVSNAPIVGKEPWLAVLLSTIFPGIGHLYAGKTLKGSILISVTLVLLGLGGWLVINPTGSVWLALQCLIGYFLLVIFSLFDAYRSARISNNREFEQLRQGDKDPWLAVFLSKIVPGLGHVYQRQWLFAIVFFVLFIVTVVIAQKIAFMSLVAIALSYFCFYHAYTASPTRREKSRRLILGVCFVLLAVQLLSTILALSLKTFVMEARYIPSKSMEPALQIDDRLIVEKISYRVHPPERMDIVVFLPPAEVVAEQGIDTAFVSRIIGLPGETIEVKDGTVYINAQPLVEDYVANPPSYAVTAAQIPAHAYFVLGDNRDQAYDSHAWGFLPQDNIIGKATKIFWPLNRSGSLLKGDAQ